MKKRVLKVGAFLSILTLSTIGVKMVNTEQISSVGLVFSNMEALASDSEGGGRGKACSYSRVYSGKEYETAYECINGGRTVCIVWNKYTQTGPGAGYCTNARYYIK